MADAKISALTQLTGAGSTADADELVLVDKSDTTMAASGTDKRVTVADLAVGVFERPLQVFTNTTPAAPATGLKLFARERPTGFRRIGVVGPNGIDVIAQSAMWNNTLSWMVPNGNATTLAVRGLTATAIGTATAANWASTNLLTSLKRLSYISAATAGAAGGVKHNLAQWWRGNAAGLGGFFYSVRFGFPSLPATQRWLACMYGSTTNPGNVDPSTLLNLVGVGKDVGDTNMFFLHNDGTATCTKVDTGLAAPTAGQVIEVRVFCKPNDTVVAMSVQNLNVGSAVLYTSPTTKLPANTLGLLPMLWANNGTTAATIDPHLVSMYLETDY